MNKGWRIIFSVLLVLTACGRKPDKADMNPMLASVPSDAVAAAVYERLGDVLSTLVDSTDVLNRISYGRLLQNRAALSFCYTSALTPVLAIETGSDSADNSSIDHILDRAASLKLSARFLPGDMGGVLVISQSETLAASVERHLREGASIMDAQGFGTALEQAGTPASAIYLRNAGAQRWLPADTAGGMFPKRDAASFLRTFSEWMVIVPQQDGTYNMFPEKDGSPEHYFTLLDSMKKKHLEILDAVPENTDFILSESTEDEKFRSLYESYLDANVKLDKYAGRLRDIRRSSGKNLLDAEKELGIREVSVIRWEGRRISLVRCSREARDTVVEENRWEGMVSALYGKAFETEDGWTCSKGCWKAFGSKEDMEAFATVRTENNDEKNSTFYLRTGDTAISCNDKGIRIWNWNSNQ